MPILCLQGEPQTMCQLCSIFLTDGSGGVQRPSLKKKEKLSFSIKVITQN